MTDVASDPVGSYLADLMRLIVRASPGPLTAIRRPSGAYQIRTRSIRRPLATFARGADADLYVTAAADLRALAGTVAELLAGHRDDGRGQCVACGQHSPCRT